jgi:hypothetical protein
MRFIFWRAVSRPASSSIPSSVRICTGTVLQQNFRFLSVHWTNTSKSDHLLSFIMRTSGNERVNLCLGHLWVSVLIADSLDSRDVAACCLIHLMSLLQTFCPSSWYRNWQKHSFSPALLLSIGFYGEPSWPAPGETGVVGGVHFVSFLINPF